MLKYLIAFSMLAFPAYSYHSLEVFGGSGFVSASAQQQDYFAGIGTTKVETTDSVYMRQSLFLGLRYTSYSPKETGAFLMGFELSGLLTSPTTNGKWKYTRLDTDGNVTGNVTQDMTGGSAPALNAFRGSFHLGYNIPFGQTFAVEFGALTGLGGSATKYTYSSAFLSGVTTGGTSTGSSGLSLHGALRFALQIIPVSSVAIAFEYRYMAEVSGSLFSLFPGLQSNISSTSWTGHLFLVSVGYRFGSDLPTPK